MQPEPGPGRERPGASARPPPAADLRPEPPPLQAPQQAGDTPLGGGPAGGENAPRPQHQPGGLPAPCPAAVSDPRSRTPSPGGFPSPIPRPQPPDLLSHRLLDGGRRGPNFPGAQGPAPSPAPKSTRLQRPTLRGGSEGSSVQLAGKELGRIYETWTSKDQRRSSQGGGREFLERGVKFSIEKDQGRIL